MSSAQVMEQMRAAKDEDALNTVMDLANTLTRSDDERRAEGLLRRMPGRPACLSSTTNRGSSWKESFTSWCRQSRMGCLPP